MLRLKVIYLLIFTSLTAWAFFAFYTMNQIISEQQKYAKLINISGKQRMLSQRLALYAGNYFYHKSVNLSDFSLLLHELKLNQAYLNNNLVSNALKLHYHQNPNLQKLFSHFLTCNETFINQPNTQNLLALYENSQTILPVLHKAVNLFEASSDATIQALESREMLILVGTLVTLLLEFLFFALPSMRNVNQQEMHLKQLVEERTKELEQMSITDRLTGLYNRHAVDTQLHAMIPLHRECDLFSLIIIDIDDFKQINDNYGHLQGDDVLKSIAKTLQTTIRSDDFAARWGGEEFLIIAKEHTHDKLFPFAEKLRSSVETLEHAIDTNVTISIGISTYIQGEEIKETLIRADKALYKAKELGKNQIQFFYN